MIPINTNELSIMRFNIPSKKKTTSKSLTFTRQRAQRSTETARQLTSAYLSKLNPRVQTAISSDQLPRDLSESRNSEQKLQSLEENIHVFRQMLEPRSYQQDLEQAHCQNKIEILKAQHEETQRALTADYYKRNERIKARKEAVLQRIFTAASGIQNKSIQSFRQSSFVAQSDSRKPEIKPRAKVLISKQKPVCILECFATERPSASVGELFVPRLIHDRATWLLKRWVDKGIPSTQVVFARNGIQATGDHVFDQLAEKFMLLEYKQYIKDKMIQEAVQLNHPVLIALVNAALTVDIPIVRELTPPRKMTTEERIQQQEQILKQLQMKEDRWPALAAYSCFQTIDTEGYKRKIIQELREIHHVEQDDNHVNLGGFLEKMFKDQENIMQSAKKFVPSTDPMKDRFGRKILRNVENIWLPK